MKNLSFVILLPIIIFSVPVFAQYLAYNSTENTYSLKNMNQLRGAHKDSLEKYINLAINYNNRDAFQKIVNVDPSNIKTLIAISNEVKTRTPAGFAEWDQFSFKDVLNEVLDDAQLHSWAFYYHFLFIYENQLQGLNLALKDIQSDYSSWLPEYITNRQELLLLLRHILFKYSATNKIPTDQYIMYNAFFRDASIFSLNKNYEVSVIEYHKSNPQASLNIENSDISVKVSSELSKKYNRNNVLDYDMNTVWAEGSENDGINAWMEIKLKNKEYVENLVLFPGHSKSQFLFKANNRIKELEIEYNGKSKQVKIQDLFLPVSISIQAETQEIKLNILAIYKGSKYNDLCVSEIMLTRSTQ